MEKLGRNVSLTSRGASKFVVLFSLCLLQTCVECQERVIGRISTEEPPSISIQLKDRRRLQKIMMSIFLGVISGLILAVVFGFLVRWFIRFINRTPILRGPVVFSPKIDPKTLQSALNNENQLLGSSHMGRYYRTVLDNGLIIAVKRLEPFENNGSSPERKRRKRMIHEELEKLASLRHRNLMSLRAYVRESDRFSLVYDYMPAGSLEDTMKRVRENQIQLIWDVRLRIAVGIVKGLQYLHFTCVPRILHYNLNPSNVMLDAQFEPRLVDFGLAKLVTTPPNFDRGAESAYNAPECLQNCSRYSEKSDVYSFGVILGVLLTGRDPMDPLFGGSLGGWLKQQVQESAGEGREALDKTCILTTTTNHVGVGEDEELVVEEDEMLMAVRIAVVCLSDLPADRPSSDELVSMLTQLHSF